MARRIVSILLCFALVANLLCISVAAEIEGVSVPLVQEADEDTVADSICADEDISSPVGTDSDCPVDATPIVDEAQGENVSAEIRQISVPVYQSTPMTAATSAANATAATVVATGSMGESIKYTVYSDGSCQITGSGFMSNYSEQKSPLKDVSIDINEVTIEEGIESIGANILPLYTPVRHIQLPSSLKTIGANGLALSQSSNGDYHAGIDQVVLPDGVQSIGSYGCAGVKQLQIPISVNHIGYNGLSGVSEIYYRGSASQWKSLNYTLDEGTKLYYNASIPPVDTSRLVENYIDYGMIGTDGLLWSINAAGKLRISGKGAMSKSANTTYLIPWMSQYRTAIKDVVIDNGVTTIVDSGFRECTNLRSVTLPAKLDYIGTSAFYQCTSLTSVQIVSCRTIGGSAFRGCTSLSSVSIGECEKLGDTVFVGCTALSSVTLPASGMKYIGVSAFNRCPIASITLPQGLQELGNYALAGTAISSVVIPDSVTTVGTALLSNCKNLKSVSDVTFPQGLAQLPDRFFAGSGIVSFVDFPESITQLGSEVFDGCQALTIVAPSHSVDVNRDTFVGIGSLERAVLTNCRFSIKGISFKDCRKLTELVLPQGVEYVNISGCVSMTEFDAPDGASVDISGCTALRRLSASGDVSADVTVGYNACSNLEEITLGEGVTSLRLVDCTKLKSIHLPDSLVFSNCYHEAIPPIVYLPGCSGLKEIAVNDTNPNYKAIDGVVYSKDGKTLLYCAPGITELVIPEGVERINGFAFFASRITDITLPSTLQGIGHRAFGYSNLRFIVIPASVSDMRMQTFYCCYNLRDAIIEGPVDIPNFCFFRCTKLTNVDLPTGEYSIGARAFSGCSSLKEITLQEGLTEIGYAAFSPTGLTEVTIPKSVETIEYISFGYTYTKLLDNNLRYDTMLTYLHPMNPSPGFVIKGYVDSAAQAYANCPQRFDTGWTATPIPFIGLDGGTEDDPPSPGPGGDQDPDEPTTPDNPDDPDNPDNPGQDVENPGDDGQGDHNDQSHSEQSGSSPFPDENASTGDDDSQGGGESSDEPGGEHGSQSGEGQGDAIDDAINEFEAYGDSCLVGAKYHTWINIDGEYRCSECGVTHVSHGYCGEALSYVLAGDTQNGYRLYVYGTGAMTQFTSRIRVPWQQYAGMIKRVYLSNELTSIGDYAFFGCSSLNSVIIPGSVSEIGAEAFRGCQGMSSLKLNHGLKTIGEYAFAGCFALAQVDLPGTLREIGSYAFYNCRNLITTLPAQLEKLGSSAFYYCTSLTSVTIPDAISVISSQVFYGCTSLSQLQLPSAVSSIGSYAFFGCAGIKEIELPITLQSIASGAFENCAMLRKVLFHSDPTVGDSAFHNCAYGLTLSCHRDGTVDTYARDNTIQAEYVHFFRFGECTICHALCSHEDENEDNLCDICGLTMQQYGACGDNAGYQIVENVGGGYDLVISGSGAMWDYSISTPAPWWPYADAIDSISLEGISGIGSYAFADLVKITKLDLGSTIITIGTCAFANCIALEELTVHPETISIGRDAFIGCDRLNFMAHPGSYAQQYAEENSLWYLPTHFSADSSKDKQPCVCTGCQYTVSKLITHGQNTYRTFTLTDENGNSSMVYCFYGSDTFQGYSKPEQLTWNYNENITELYLSRNFTVLGQYALFGIPNVTALRLPERLETLETGALCLPALTELHLPETLARIKTGSIRCSSIRTIMIPKSLTYAESGSISDCTSLERIELEEGRTSFPGIFSYCNNVKEIVFPSTLKTLGSLNGLNGITELHNLPDGLEKINSRAFQYLTNLTSVTIPDTVTSIGNYAFAGCTKLAEVNLPSSLTSLGNYAFSGCTSLKEMVVPGNVVSVGDYAFDECTSLQRLRFEDGVASIIGQRACNNCTALEDVVLSDSLVSLGDYAFCQCKSLSHIALPASLEKVGSYCFMNCTALSEITLPDGVLLKPYAFCSCSALKTVTLQGSLKCDGAYQFPDTVEVVYVPDLDSWLNCVFPHLTSSPMHSADQLYIGGKLVEGTLIIPDGVTFIPASSFANTNITTLVLPDSLLKIGGNAFANTKITSIDIPPQVESVGTLAFGGCTELSQITLHQGLKQLNQDCFMGTAIEEIDIPDTVTLVGGFNSCSQLTRVKMSINASSLGSYCFANCTALEAIDLPVTLTTLGAYSLSGCKKITRLSIPKGVSSIGAYAFSNDSALVSIDMPPRLSLVGDGAFSGCYKLESMVISGPATVGESVFSSCGALKSIVFKDGVKSIGTACAYNLRSLESVSIQNSPAAIGKNAFYYCFALQHVDLGNKTVSIGDTAFYECNKLTEIRIPGSVKTLIGKSAFSGCTSLKTVVMEQGVKGWDKLAFYRCPVKTAVIPPSVNNTATNNLVPTGEIYVHAGSKADTLYKKSYSKLIKYTHFYNDEGECVFSGCNETCAHKSYSDEVISPTCTEAGYTLHTCDSCGHSYQDTPVEALGHQWERICDDVILLNEDAVYDYLGYRYVCTRCGAVQDETVRITTRGAHVTGYTGEPAMVHSISATFDGKVKLNFYLKMPQEVLNDSNAYVIMSKDGNTVQQLVSTALTREFEGTTCHLFSYGVVAKEFDDDVSLRLFLGDGTLVDLIRSNNHPISDTGYAFSVNDYIETIKGASSDEKMVALAEATETYGSVAQIYFGYNADGLSVDDALSNVEISQLNKYAPQKDTTPIDGILGQTMTLMFEADNSFRLYFTYAKDVDPLSFTYTIDGETATLKQRSTDNKYYLEVSNISASQLADMHQFTAQKNGSVYHWSGSALTYARGLMMTSKAKSQNLGKALYLYYLAASDYFEAQ